MVITSSVLFYQLEKKCNIILKKAPSDKLQIKNIRIYDGNKTEVTTLYLVDCKKHLHQISPKKPVTLIFINAKDVQTSYFPRNCDYAIIDNVYTETELFEKVSDCINELQEWDCRLKDGVNYRYPLEEYIPIGNEVINEPIYILNRNLSLLSISDSTKDVSNTEIELDDPSVKLNKIGNALEMDHANELLADDEYHETSKNLDTYCYADCYDHEYLCMNIFSDNRYIARVMLPIKKYCNMTDEGQLQLLRHFFKYLKQVYLRYSEDPLIKNSTDKLHSLIRDMVLNPGNVDGIDANFILQNSGWNNSHRYSVIKLSFFKNAKWDEITEYICGKLEETWSNSCAIKHNEDIIWVFNHSVSKDTGNDRKFYHVLAYIVRDFICKAGVSDEFTGLEKLPSYLLQSETALKIGQKSNPDRWYYKFSDYALDYMFDRIVSEFSIEQLIYVGVRKLIDYDLANETDYLVTLRCFLYNNCNSTHTADELFIHRTTLIRRIDRIQEISGIDFKDHDTHIYLILSFWILERLGFSFSNISASSTSLLQ